MVNNQSFLEIKLGQQGDIFSSFSKNNQGYDTHTHTNFLKLNWTIIIFIFHAKCNHNKYKIENKH